MGLVECESGRKTSHISTVTTTLHSAIYNGKSTHLRPLRKAGIVFHFHHHCCYSSSRLYYESTWQYFLCYLRIWQNMSCLISLNQHSRNAEFSNFNPHLFTFELCVILRKYCIKESETWGTRLPCMNLSWIVLYCKVYINHERTGPDNFYI